MQKITLRLASIKNKLDCSQIIQILKMFHIPTKSHKHRNLHIKSDKVSELYDNDELYSRLIEELMASKYTNRWRLYKVNFFRGVAFGLGSFLAATFGVMILLWILRLVGKIPFIGDITKIISDSLQ